MAEPIDMTIVGNTSKPNNTWLCAECGYYNVTRVTECEICGYEYS